MCKIEEVKSYQIFGKLHGTREAAVQAGLTEVADTLKKNHANNLLGGLQANADDLVYLLTEWRSLHPLPSAPAETPGEKAWTLPEGEEFRSHDAIMADIMEKRNAMNAAQRRDFDGWITESRGYDGWTDFYRTATGSDHNRAAERLGIPITMKAE
jgi:hypothetical protein